MAMLRVAVRRRVSPGRSNRLSGAPSSVADLIHTGRRASMTSQSGLGDGRPGGADGAPDGVAEAAGAPRAGSGGITVAVNVGSGASGALGAGIAATGARRAAGSAGSVSHHPRPPAAPRSVVISPRTVSTA